MGLLAIQPRCSSSRAPVALCAGAVARVRPDTWCNNAGALPGINSRRRPMRKIIIGAQLSLDGIMQSPGGPSEDPTGGFRFGGWSMPWFDQEAGEEMQRLFAERFDLLLGRKTYEIFAAYWPFYHEEGPTESIATLFNGITKYVVSRSGDVDTNWTNSVLLRDIAAVTRLRQEEGPTLLTQGSTELVHALLASDLVDGISMFTMPVVLGSGKKLFADGSAPHEFKLTGSRVCSSGVVVTHYARGGAVNVDNAALGSPSEAERARRTRMEREG